MGNFPFDVFVLFKWLFVGGLVIYCGFAVVIIMQVKVMTEAFESMVNGLVKFFAVVHLILAILLVIVAAILL